MKTKTEQLHIYLTPEELAQIKKKAEDFGLPISQYAKLKIFDKIK